MKTRILLIDESITVQKVVSLTLDKSQYALVFAKSRAEATTLIPSELPDVILISDQMTGIHIPSFPKELETWLGGQKPPPVVLIASNEIREARHYAAVLKKPFTPQALKAVIEELTEATPGFPAEDSLRSDESASNLEKILETAFPDESELTRQTFGNSLMEERKMPELWGESTPAPAPAPVSSFERSRPSYQEKPMERTPERLPETAVREALHTLDLEEAVDRALARLLPPIVERIVQERLDALLKEQERFVEAKP